MRTFPWVFAVLTALFLTLSPAPSSSADPGLDPLTRRRLESLDSALDELNSMERDNVAHRRASRGERLNQAFVALTGEAINPLFGVTALGMYTYFRTPDHLREALPVYDQPVVWVPLLCIILLMLFNSTICEAIPPLKVPLNALGDIVNKAGAVAVLPLVVKMFADQFAQPVANELASLANTLFPVAFAAEAGMASAGFWGIVGWLGAAIVGFVVYGVVWLAFNVIDVLIVICPFPGVDALLKSFRLTVIALLAGSYQLSPGVAAAIAVVVTLASLLLAGWSFRLSVFGLIFSTDILFFRSKRLDAKATDAFSCSGLKAARGIPMRTWGSLHKSGGELFFSYRPWLVLSRREVALGKADGFDAGRGFLNPFLLSDGGTDAPWLRLPPRYRGNEEEFASSFGLRQVLNCGVSGAFRDWLAQNFGRSKTEEATA